MKKTRAANCLRDDAACHKMGFRTSPDCNDWLFDTYLLSLHKLMPAYCLMNLKNQ